MEEQNAALHKLLLAVQACRQRGVCRYFNQKNPPWNLILPCPLFCPSHLCKSRSSMRSDRNAPFITSSGGYDLHTLAHGAGHWDGAHIVHYTVAASNEIRPWFNLTHHSLTFDIDSWNLNTDPMFKQPKTELLPLFSWETKPCSPLCSKMAYVILLEFLPKLYLKNQLQDFFRESSALRCILGARQVPSGGHPFKLVHSSPVGEVDAKGWCWPKM